MKASEVLSVELSEVERVLELASRKDVSRFGDVYPMTLRYMRALYSGSHPNTIHAPGLGAQPSDIGPLSVSWLGGASRNVGGDVRDLDTAIADDNEDSLAQVEARLGSPPKLSLTRVRSATPRDLRGQSVRRAVGPMFVHDLAIISEKRTVIGPTRIATWTGGRARVSHLQESWNPVAAEDVERAVGLALNIAFAARYDWHVCLREEGAGIGVRFVTDPTGAAEVFRLREVPSGARRRSALLHWVKLHWRQRRDGGQSEVRAHLRGAQEFNWNGLRCTIRASAFDRDRVAS